MDFEVQRFTRRCCKTEQEIRPGERFVSVLVPEGAHVRRFDYSEAAWQGPPANAIGWWKSQVPEPEDNRVHWAPSDVMINFFEQLEGQEAKQDVRYILALLMVRRRVARLEEVEQNDQGQEIMILYCPRNEQEYRVTVTQVAGDRVQEIQQELAGLLFADTEQAT
jgi:hypothetical protein